jgi:hypothetical protein
MKGLVDRKAFFYYSKAKLQKIVAVSDSLQA